ncbi:hypothetical protein EV07_1716 [Prochlorococcus sp. MIT 0603]|nr:hypothetical protein EV07_1716 [Prochlorococcus sp. MIT 0603]
MNKGGNIINLNPLKVKRGNLGKAVSVSSENEKYFYCDKGFVERKYLANDSDYIGLNKLDMKSVRINAQFINKKTIEDFMNYLRSNDVEDYSFEEMKDIVVHNLLVSNYAFPNKYSGVGYNLQPKRNDNRVNHFTDVSIVMAYENKKGERIFINSSTDFEPSIIDSKGQVFKTIIGGSPRTWYCLTDSNEASMRVVELIYSKDTRTPREQRTAMPMGIAIFDIIKQLTPYAEERKPSL